MITVTFRTRPDQLEVHRGRSIETIVRARFGCTAIFHTTPAGRGNGPHRYTYVVTHFQGRSQVAAEIVKVEGEGEPFWESHFIPRHEMKNQWYSFMGVEAARQRRLKREKSSV